MKADTTIGQQLKRFQLPAQELKQLEFCGGRKASQVAAWVAELPLTRVNFVSGLLYTALQETARLKTDVTSRLQILEELRPATLQCIELLSRSFLNQPLMLPDSALKAATVAQALQKHLSNGYMVALRDSLNDETGRDKDRALACQRAITGLGLLLLRAWQVYTPPPSQVWNELHAIYCLAEPLDILRQPVTDPHPDHRRIISVDQAYRRVLLLASSRPNQLRQGEILETYRALETLSARALLSRSQEARGRALFCVDLAGDTPPDYSSRLTGVDQSRLLALETDQVVAALKDPTNPGAAPAYHLSLSLTDHLTQAWGREHQRKTDRKPSHNHLEVALGLSGLHYHLSGGRLFSDFLMGPDAAEQPSDDHFFGLFGDRQLPSGMGRDTSRHIDYDKDKHPPPGEEYPVYRVPLVDTGPGGYCLEWPDDIPPQVKAGELIGLREKSHSNWAVGVIRWVLQTRRGTQLGVQVLATRATPLGVAVVYNTGGFSEYLRGLETQGGRQKTLVTNSVSFREFARVRLFRESARQARESHGQLSRRLFSTGAISQFELEDMGTADADTRG